MVPVAGLEPAHISATDFESVVSTNSTILALVLFFRFKSSQNFYKTRDFESVVSTNSAILALVLFFAYQ